MKAYTKIVDSNGKFVNKYSQEIIDVLEKWLACIKDKSQLLLEDIASSSIEDGLIKLIDDDLICNESWRISQQFEALPEFCRLVSGARKGMTEDLVNIVTYQRNHAEEYFKEI